MEGRSRHWCGCRLRWDNSNELVIDVDDIVVSRDTCYMKCATLLVCVYDWVIGGRKQLLLIFVRSLLGAYAMALIVRRFVGV